MTGALIFALLLIVTALVAAAAVVAIAARRTDDEGAATAGEFDRKAKKADQERQKVAASVGAVAVEPAPADEVVYVPAPHEFEEDAPKEPISYDSYGVTRRKFFNRAIGAVFGLFMLQFTLAGLAFIWP